MPRSTQPPIDLETAVDVWVIDQPLPTDGGAGFLEVGAHDYQQVFAVQVFELEEFGGVFEGGRWVVDGTGADNDEEAVVGVLAVDDRDDFFAGGYDRGFGFL